VPPDIDRLLAYDIVGTKYTYRTGSIQFQKEIVVAERHQRNVTISDVARAAGVSKATVSIALRGDDTPVAPRTRLRIQEAAERLGYERSALALALSVGRTYTIGLVSQVDAFSDNTSRINTYQKDVMVAVTCACARAGLRMTTILARSHGSTAPAEITDGRIDGVILATLRDDALSEAIFQRGFPAVTIGSGYSERRVWPDNRGGLRSAIDHLVDLGHHRIAYVGYSLSVVDSWTTQERAAGYEEAMQAHNRVPFSVSMAQLPALLAKPAATRPTACVCFNDNIAIEVLREARARGIAVPSQLSVIGFDDEVTARTADPRLTTIENPLDQQAEAAITLLQTLWRAEEALSPPPIPTRLIVRASTAVAP
jgi:DNA-binding LacI/PurR family transcriptional regulator